MGIFSFLSLAGVFRIRRQTRGGLLVMGLLLFLGAAGGVRGQEAPDLLTPEERQWVAEHGNEFLLAPTPDSPPVEFFDTRGRHSGIAADLMRLLEKRLGIRFKIVRYRTWDEVVEAARLHRIDLTSIAQQTTQRESFWNFSTPFLDVSNVMITDHRIAGDLTLDALQGYRTAIVKGYALNELLARDHPALKLIPVEDDLAGLTRLGLGDVDVMLSDLPTAVYLIQRESMTGLRVAGDMGYHYHYSIASRSDWPLLGRILQKGLDSITAGERAEIYQRWVKLDLPVSRFWKIFAEILAGLLLVLAVGLAWMRSMRNTEARRRAEIGRILEEQRRVERELRNSEAYNKLLFYSSRMALVVLDPRTRRFIDCNPAAVTLYGFGERGELLGKTPADVSPPGQADGTPSEAGANEIIARAREQGEQVFEWLHQRPSGETWIAEMHLMLFKTEEQELIQISLRDITARRRAEEALRQLTAELERRVAERTADLERTNASLMGEIGERERAEALLRNREARFKAIMEQSPVPMMLFDSQGLLADANEAWVRMWDSDRAAIIGRYNILQDPQAEFLRPYVERALRGESVNIPEHYYDPAISGMAGQPRWLTGRVYPLKDPRDVINNFILINEDATDRIQSQQALRESEARFKALFELAPFACAVNDTAGRFLIVNDTFLRNTGLSPGETIGRTPRELGLLGDLPDEEPIVRELFRSGRVSNLELKANTPEGTRDILCSSRLIDLGGRQHVISTMLDITGLKQAEAALREGERNYREIFNATSDALFIHDVTGQILDVNAPMCVMFHCDRAMALALGANDSSLGEPPYSAAEAGEFMRRALEEGPQLFEWISRRMDGELFWSEVALRACEIGGRTRVIAAVRDISERKRTEERLFQSEEKFSKIYQTVPDGIVISRLGDGVVLDVNPGFEDILGYPKEEVTGRTSRELGLWSDACDRDLARELLRAQGEMLHSEFPLRHRDGSVRVCTYAARELEIDGEHCVAAVIQDITERKRAEERLRGRERQLQAQSETLLTLMMSGTLFRGDFDQAIHEITEAGSRLLGTGRVSVWLYSSDFAMMRCINRYEAETGRHSAGEERRSAAFPAYTERHRQGQVVAAADVFSDPRTREIPETYYREHDIRSLLDAPFWLENRIGGLLSFEAVGAPRHWTAEDERAATTMATLVSLCCENAERKRTEEALRQSEESIRTTLNSIGDAVIATDAQGRIQRMNPVAEALTGWEMAAAQGRLLREVFRIVERDTGRPDADPVARVLRQGQVVSPSGVTQLISRGGREAIIADSGAPIRDKAGRIVGVVLVFRDVTDQFRKERLLRHQQKLEAIGTLAGGVAHEINNPINIILNFGQLILDNAPPDSQTAEDAGEIVKECRRIAEIVRNLLTFSRQENERHSPVPPGEVINSTLTLVRKILDKDAIAIEVQSAPDLPKVLCSSQQIMQVLMNLIINARDALNEKYPGTHPDKRIRITARTLEGAGPQRIQIAVEDHGEGIPAAIHDRIFDPFFTTKPRDKGTGLGLSISHGIVKEHHGMLYLETRLGEGTRFILELPVKGGWLAPPEEDATAEPENNLND